ncbi:MAG: hypothetical protein MI919_33410, partial [Holophagales bacterium]|nr:hypothetical protein [Holophagales bacterium]
LSGGADPFVLEILLDNLIQAGVLAEPLDLDGDGNLADLPSPSLLPIASGPPPPGAAGGEATTSGGA